ncbi:MAG: FGGY-family carbohydrate kinase [Aeromicrobium sp.]
MTSLLLGIDLGTGSSKGVLATPDGQIVATAVRPRPHSMSMPFPGWAEVDAVEVWWQDVMALSRELVPQAAGAEIAAVCVSGVGPCLVLADEEGWPVRPAILYGIDSRATAEIAELDETLGSAAVLQRCGTPLTTQAVGPKALWVRRHEPDAWERATRWFNSSSFVAFRLAGEYVLDHHTASQSVPLYDIEANAWTDDWYDDVMDPIARPRLVWPSEVVGSMTARAAEQTGLPVGTPVCAGTVDAWAEAFSGGVRSPGDLMLMYGSTMFFVQELAAFARHPQLWNTVGIEPGSKCLAAGMSTSGSLTGWVQELVGDVPFETLVREAAAVPAGSEGLLLLPYFSGERTPIFDHHARGVIAGLTLRHTRGHIFRAVYEGIAFGIKQILELLDTEANPVERLVALGGGTQGSLWTQVVSDVTGRAQEVPEHTIGAAYGDALMAAIGAGLVPPETDWARVADVVEPNPEHRALYDELYDLYCSLYPATRDHAHALARMQELAAGPVASPGT